MYTHEIRRLARNWTVGRYGRMYDRDDYEIACVLITSVVVGADVDKCAKRLKLPLEQVAKIAASFEEHGIWKDGVAQISDWSDEDDGELYFQMDMLRAKGLVEIVEEPDTEAQNSDGGLVETAGSPNSRPITSG